MLKFFSTFYRNGMCRETSSHPRCVQSRTHLPASMFVIKSTIIGYLSFADFGFKKEEHPVALS